MRWHGILLLLALLPSSSFAEERSAPLGRVQLLPPLTETPEAGVDRDYALALEAAEAQLSEGRTAEAIDELVALLSSTDRFFLAQREAVSARAVPLLRRAADAEAQAGRLEAAAFARDAAWIASGYAADPAHAQLLLTLAEQRRSEEPEEALWLVRRAARANPLDPRAAERDRAWSSNPLRFMGWGMMTAGVASVVASAVLVGLSNGTTRTITGSVHPRAEVDSLIATQRAYGVASVGALVAGAALFYGGIGVVGLGNPEGPPVSPALLPALQEAP